MPPPPAESVASRLFAGPALRTQPDRRLVTLVREGYETAFEEIVRRYGKALGRYAAAIVGARSEDVAQDAFSKALVAMRRDGAEIELKPWLYRIVRNTALNDLRDRPPSPEALHEAIEGEVSAAETAQRREEMTELMTRLRALPEAQRAAIVMRELEGLSHEEIAAALGVSGGAARQAIHRARVALRDGFGMLLPLPLLRLLIGHGTEAAVAGAGSSAAVATGVTLGGTGAGGALKIGAAAVLVAGSIGAGAAIHEHGGSGGARGTTTAVSVAAEATDLRHEGGAAVPAATASKAESPSQAIEDNHGGPTGQRDSGRGSGSEPTAGDEPEPGDDFGGGHSGPPPFGSAHQGEGSGSGGPSGFGDDHPPGQGRSGGQGQAPPPQGSGGGHGSSDDGHGGRGSDGGPPPQHQESGGGGPGGGGSPGGPPPGSGTPPPLESPDGSGGGTGSGSGSDSSSNPSGGGGEGEEILP